MADIQDLQYEAKMAQNHKIFFSIRKNVSGRGWGTIEERDKRVKEFNDMMSLDMPANQPMIFLYIVVTCLPSLRKLR